LQPSTVEELSAEQRREIAAWIDAHQAEFPDAVRIFLGLHQRYLNAQGNLRKSFEAALRELRRALHLIPSSEKQRRSGSPLAGLPRKGAGSAKNAREEIEQQIARMNRLAEWHQDLQKRHDRRSKRLMEKLAKMTTEKMDDAQRTRAHEPERLEDIELELSPEEIAENQAARQRFVEHMLSGDGADPAMASVNETLMPGGTVLEREESEHLPAKIPAELTEAQVLKTLNEKRVRYDFAVSVTRIELDVEKKVVLDRDGQRRVIAASTRDFGPARYSVTWEALATLAILVGQYAMPFNRLGSLFSTSAKHFTAGALSRMLRYVARRFVPIYLELAADLANSEILAGDDTSCRVLEVSSHFAQSASAPEKKPTKPPWADYATPRIAEESFARCEQARRARIERREAGDREARRGPEETTSLGVLIGKKLAFESSRRSGDGAKQAMHTTVISGRSVAEDPRSLIVFYRSHLGSCGNLFEHILKSRDPRHRKVILQGDLSTTNLVTAPELLARFAIQQIGCAAHARRPFAINCDEAPELCEHMLHLFLGLAMHEEQLDVFGRNRENVLAVRGAESRALWNEILELARRIAEFWSKATTLGTAARYIINHFDALTAYLDDPRLEPTNNLRERMLRMEKLIEGSSMFRKSLEGRFVLDVVRTILQTAVAAGVPVHEYLTSVLREDDNAIATNPARFTPRAWATARTSAVTA
jgi:hypothetical protein